MTSDAITLKRGDAFEAAAWLFAFVELFEQLGESADFTEPCGHVAYSLAGGLCGGGLADLDDETHNSHPVLVAIFARARELVASLLTDVELETGERAPFAFAGDPFTAKGIRVLAKRFSMDAALTRKLGVICPPSEALEAALAEAAEGGGRLVCVECGRPDPGDERGWTLRLGDDDGLHAFCPDCDEREFAA